MKKVVFYLSLAAVLAVSANGFAGSGKMKGMGHGGGMDMAGMAKFNVPVQEMDTDGDGDVTWDDFSKKYEGTDKQVFDVIDTDDDGKLSQSEWDKFKSAHGMGKGKGAMKGKKHHGGKYHDADLPDPDKYMVDMPEIDQDGDDKLTWNEFKDKFDDTDRKVFDAIDLDKDGTVDQEEWHAFTAAHGHAHH
ncbi:MAG: EF-hand domain-containing protein [Desulfococcaceae bacterium]